MSALGQPSVLVAREYYKCTSAGTLHGQTARLNSDGVSPRSQSAQTSSWSVPSPPRLLSAAALSCIRRQTDARLLKLIRTTKWQKTVTVNRYCQYQC